MPSKNPTRTPKVLRKKNIFKRRSARSQAKQIATLSTRVNRLTATNYDRLRTSWQRNNLPIGAGGPIASAYVCPLPYAMCDPLGISPVPGANVWTDNRVIASQPSFTKKLIFGHSDASTNSNKIYHTGGKLRYTVYTTEPQFSKVTIALIRPKRKQSDQLVIDRGLKNATGINAAGSAGFLYEDIDYITHTGAGGPYDTYYGAEINSKYWDVLYKREIALNGPKDLTASSFTRTTPTDNPKNNSLIATGTIRLPAGGMMKAVGQATQQAQSPASAFEQQYIDQRNEDSCYLVAIQNDLQVDAENILMGFVVTDYYKAVV